METPNDRNPDNYEIPEGEEGHYHLKVTSKIHNAPTQSYDETVQIKVLRPEVFREMEASGVSFKEFSSVEILHDPTKAKGKPAPKKRTTKVDVENAKRDLANEQGLKNLPSDEVAKEEAARLAAEKEAREQEEADIAEKVKGAKTNKP